MTKDSTIGLDRYAAALGVALSLAGLVWNAALQTGRITDHDRRIVALEVADAESLKDRRELAQQLSRIDANIQMLVTQNGGRPK